MERDAMSLWKTAGMFILLKLVFLGLMASKKNPIVSL